MEISRYASRLSLTSSVPPSGRPLVSANLVIPNQEASHNFRATEPVALPSNQFPRDLPQEPDDARLTGGTRSLSRRLLALNVPTFTSVRTPASRKPPVLESLDSRAYRAEVRKPLTA